jgi:hypothetical protein
MLLLAGYLYLKSMLHDIAQYNKIFAVNASCNAVECGAECCRGETRPANGLIGSRIKVAYKFWDLRNVSSFVIASSNPFSLLNFRASPRETPMIS